MNWIGFAIFAFSSAAIVVLAVSCVIALIAASKEADINLRRMKQTQALNTLALALIAFGLLFVAHGGVA